MSGIFRTRAVPLQGAVLPDQVCSETAPHGAPPAQLGTAGYEVYDIGFRVLWPFGLGVLELGFKASGPGLPKCNAEQ